MCVCCQSEHSKQLLTNSSPQCAPLLVCYDALVQHRQEVRILLFFPRSLQAHLALPQLWPLLGPLWHPSCRPALRTLERRCPPRRHLARCRLVALRLGSSLGRASTPPRSGVPFFDACRTQYAELSNLITHLNLASLRPKGTKVRQIPKGYGFNTVSCGNYFFETIAWCAFTGLTLNWACKSVRAVFKGDRASRSHDLRPHHSRT